MNDSPFARWAAPRIAARIRDRRLALGMTLEQLAELTESDRAIVGRVEAGLHMRDRASHRARDEGRRAEATRPARPRAQGTAPMTDCAEVGRKNDRAKPPWHLVPWRELAQVVDVLAHGAKKYAPDNYKRVERGQERYFSAAMRHLVAWRCGEKTDPESGLPHLAHAACDVLLMMWFENEVAG